MHHNDCTVMSAEAEDFKNQGNDAFRDSHFQLAYDLYSKAVEADGGKNAVYLANRAFAALKLEEYGQVIDDATAALAVDPTFFKAYWRRGVAKFALQKLDEAIEDFQKVVELRPEDPHAIAKLNECKKEWRRIRFEEAIQSEAHEPMWKTMKVEDIAIDKSYAGPSFGLDEPLTVEVVEAITTFMKEGGKLHRRFACDLLIRAVKVLKEEANIVDIKIPEGREVTVCGDTHGQFYDLLHIFDINGTPSEMNPYLFNGDFVDRGSWSVEVMLTLLAYKVALPNSFFLTRGNHETRSLNRMYGFEGEVRAKYNDRVFELFMEVFNWLPLACLINQGVLVLHGGLFSIDGVTLDDIRAINRNQEIPESGLMCEMLWSDPGMLPGRKPSKRGVACQFGPDVTERFLQDNNLKLLVRSHECKDNGYEEDHKGKCITIFSAPNYCDQMGNKGAFIRFGEDLEPHFTVFDAVPHPDVKPMAYGSSMLLR